MQHSRALVRHALKLADQVWHNKRPADVPAPVVPAGPSAWFVIQTVMHGEDKVAEALAAMGFESYMPMMRIEVTHHRTRRPVMREFPLLNRYVFAFLPINTGEWKTLEAIEEVAAVLGDHKGPQPVPEAEIHRLKEGEAARAFDVTKRGRFPRGSRVRVVRGPFGGFAGQVSSLPGRGIVKAMVEFLGTLRPVEFKYDMVEPD